MSAQFQSQSQGQGQGKDARYLRSVLGVNFWDATLNKPVTDGLRVSLLPLNDHRNPAIQAPVLAQANARSTSAFFDVPGISSLQWLSPDALPDPLPQIPCLLQVTDKQNRFVPMARVLNLPWTGGAPFQSSFSDEDPGLGVVLFPSATRSAGAGWISVRVEAWSVSASRPAAHAVLKLTLGEQSWFALANDQGVAQWILPGLAPSQLEEGPVAIDVRAYFDFAGLAEAPGALIPDQADVLGQPQVRIHSDPDTDPADVFSSTLSETTQVVLRTEGQSRLWLAE